MEALDWQKKAVAEVGDGGANAIYELRLPFATSGGSFAVSVGAGRTTPLPFSASALQIQTALELLPAIAVGGITVSGPKTGPFYLELSGDNAGQWIEEGWLSADGSLLQPPATLTPVLLQNGRSMRLDAGAAKLWGEYGDKVAGYERYLFVKHDLLIGELARYARDVDGRDNDAESKQSQRFAQLRVLLNEVKGAIDRLDASALAAGTGQTFAGMTRIGAASEIGFALAQRPGRWPGYWR